MVIVHKYEVGDTVLFKHKFTNPSCGLVGKEGTWAKITGIAPSYNNRPHYYISATDSVFPERVFEGKVH